MSDIQIKPETFFKHHHTLLDAWKKNEQEFDCVVISNGKTENNKFKTSSINVWYFGYDIIDTLLAFTKKSIIFIASAKKLKMMASFKETSEFKDHNMQFFEKDPKDNVANLDKLHEILRSDCEKDDYSIGHIVSEPQQGPLQSEYETFLGKNSQIKIVDCADFISEIFLVKDSQELVLIQKASKLTKYFFLKMTEEFERIIEEEEKCSHKTISEKIQDLLDKPSEQARVKAKYQVDSNAIDYAYQPMIQSGGKYDLFSTTPSEENLQYDTLINSMSVSYSQYNANISRTFFIDPVDEQKKTYEAFRSVHHKILNTFMKAGTKLSEVYEQAVALLKQKLPEISDEHIPKNFGQGIGLYYKEENISISPLCEKEIKNGMVFNVQTGANNLKINGKDKQYAILLADTLIINPNQLIYITTEVPSTLENISYSINDDDEESEQGEDDNKPERRRNNNGMQEENNLQGNRYKTRQRGSRNEQVNVDKQQQAQQKEHQLQLRRDKIDEMKQRLIDDGFTSSKQKQAQVVLDKLNPYKSETDIPENLKKNQIYVDNKRQCVLLPINQQHVPLHVHLIKNITKQDEGNKTYSMRLNLHFPTTGTGSQGLQFPEQQDKQVFIKELSFRSKNEGKLNDTIKKIKELQKKVKQQWQDKINAGEDVDREQLQLIKGKRPVLKDLKIRPAISTKKSSGMLECHQNGFKYTTQRHEHCEITFNNIKHAFFQPCDFEMIIVLHFHLKNPILLNKKKVTDVQFYTDAGVAAVDLNQRRRGGYDDDYDDEEQEKQQRKKLNRDFRAFTKACEEIAGENVAFERPYRDLGFDGAPQRATVFLQPTNSCLINVVETPQFILTIDDVELCCFERMMGGLKNFDLVFVFKDYDRPIQRITAIPIAKAEEVKSWLDKNELIFFESTRAISWITILNEIKKDIEGFVEDGGWEPVLEDDEEQAGSDSDLEGDSSFGGSVSGSSSDDDDDSSDFSGSGSMVSEEDEEDYSDASGDGSDMSEEGLSWSELDKKARRDDEDAAKRRTIEGRPQQMQPQKKVQKRR